MAKHVVVCVEGSHCVGKTAALALLEKEGECVQRVAFMDIDAADPRGLFSEFCWMARWYERLSTRILKNPSGGIIYTHRSPASALWYAKRKAVKPLSALHNILYERFLETHKSIEIRVVVLSVPLDVLKDRVLNRLASEPRRANYKEGDTSWLCRTTDFFCYLNDHLEEFFKKRAFDFTHIDTTDCGTTAVAEHIRVFAGLSDVDNSRAPSPMEEDARRTPRADQQATHVIICIEGCHGVGKTTTVSHLEKNGSYVQHESFMDIGAADPRGLFAECYWMAHWYERLSTWILKNPDGGIMYTDRSPVSAIWYARPGVSSDLRLINDCLHSHFCQKFESAQFRRVVLHLPFDTLKRRVLDRLGAEPRRAQFDEGDMDWLAKTNEYYTTVTAGLRIDTSEGDASTVAGRIEEFAASNRE